MRFHNPFWLGTPHYSTADFAYDGYWIPKGTVVIANTVRIFPPFTVASGLCRPQWVMLIVS